MPSRPIIGYVDKLRNRASGRDCFSPLGSVRGELCFVVGIRLALTGVYRMGDFESRYWNLFQAAAWVVFRDRTTVNGGENPSGIQWAALMIYPSMSNLRKVGRLQDLETALCNGVISATGRRNDNDAIRAVIPPMAWLDLRLSPPHAQLKSGQIPTEPWIDIFFESADLKRNWRGHEEKSQRSSYDWDFLRDLFHEVSSQHSAESLNRRIELMQAHFKAEKKLEGPSRSAIRDRIKAWKLGR